MNLMRDFLRKFGRAAGIPESMKKEAQKHGCRKMYGIAHSREIFGQPKRSTAWRGTSPLTGMPTLNSLGLTRSPRRIVLRQ